MTAFNIVCLHSIPHELGGCSWLDIDHWDVVDGVQRIRSLSRCLELEHIWLTPFDVRRHQLSVRLIHVEVELAGLRSCNVSIEAREVWLVHLTAAVVARRSAFKIYSQFAYPECLRTADSGYVCELS